MNWQARRANALRNKAAALFEQFNEAFWDEDLGFYAYALDGEKKKVLSVASNAGQCLWSGIVPPERAERVVKRLMAQDMWSGWGIRTLSANHPRSIHTLIRPARSGRTTTPSLRWGSSCTGSLPRRRASRVTLAARQAISSSISCPNSTPRRSARNEFSGAVYRRQCATSLGGRLRVHAHAGAARIFSDAPRNKLYVDPALPLWLPDLTVRDLRIGKHKLDMRFWREGGETAL